MKCGNKWMASLVLGLLVQANLAVADIRLWLQPQDNHVVEVWAVSDESPRAVSQVTVALQVSVEPVETVYSLPTVFRGAWPAPQGMITRWFVPPMTGRWADEPVTWKSLRTDAMIFALVVTEADLGKLVLNYDTSWVWQLKAVVDGVGTWVNVGWKDHVWDAPYLGTEPVMVLSLRFESDPGPITFVQERPDGYPVARTLFYLKQQHGRQATAVPWQAIDPPVVPAGMLMRVIEGAYQLLSHEPPQAAEARLLLEGAME